MNQISLTSVKVTAAMWSVYDLIPSFLDFWMCMRTRRQTGSHLHPSWSRMAIGRSGSGWRGPPEEDTTGRCGGGVSGWWSGTSRTPWLQTGVQGGDGSSCIHGAKLWLWSSFHGGDGCQMTDILVQGTPPALSVGHSRARPASRRSWPVWTGWWTTPWFQKNYSGSTTYHSKQVWPQLKIENSQLERQSV